MHRGRGVDRNGRVYRSRRDSGPRRSGRRAIGRHKRRGVFPHRGGQSGPRDPASEGARRVTTMLTALATSDTPPAKIVFVNRYFSPDESATSRMLSDLAFRLVERGLSVSVVTSRQLYQ